MNKRMDEAAVVLRKVYGVADVKIAVNKDLGSAQGCSSLLQQQVLVQSLYSASSSLCCRYAINSVSLQ